MAGTSAVMTALVAAAFSAGRLTAQSPPSQVVSCRATGPPAAGSVEVTVDSRASRWTDTRLPVEQGELVDIEAVGEVRPGQGYPWVGPDGLPGTVKGSMHEDMPHEALIAMVGAGGTAASVGSTSPHAQVEYIGSHRVLQAPGEGDLYLAVNDTRTGDNTGCFGVTLTPRS